MSNGSPVAMYSSISSIGVVAHSACWYEVVDDGELGLCNEVWVPAFAGMTGLGWDDGYCCYYLVVSLFEGS